MIAAIGTGPALGCSLMSTLELGWTAALFGTVPCMSARGCGDSGGSPRYAARAL